MVSAMTDIQCAVEAMRLGAFDYVTKPFDFSAVELALERAMRHRTVRKMNRLYERHLQQIVSQRSNELSATNADLKETLDKLYNSYQATLRALALALETRGAENRGHFEAVAAYCARLGAEMRLTEREMMALEQGAWLHDIGKIGVPDAILSKPGALTDDERRKVQRHVEYGMQIIHGIQLMEGAARIVEQHHEHYNGGGYPKGLAGEQICLGARIFSVADAIDAITSERPYRRPRTFELAADELVRCSGSQFDPSVVQTFRSVPLAEWKEIRRSTTAESGSERTWKEPHQNASSPSCCLAG
jgi:response regulator RpfG family c-di-GMP phosphodiesterase